MRATKSPEPTLIHSDSKCSCRICKRIFWGLSGTDAGTAEAVVEKPKPKSLMAECLVPKWNESAEPAAGWITATVPIRVTTSRRWELIRQGLLRGISARQVGRTAVTLTGEAVSAQTVSQNDVYHDPLRDYSFTVRGWKLPSFSRGEYSRR